MQRGSWVWHAVNVVSRLAMVLLPHTVAFFVLDASACLVGGLLRWLHCVLGWAWVPLPFLLCRALLAVARGVCYVALGFLGGSVFIFNFSIEMESGTAAIGPSLLRGHMNGSTASGINGGLNTYWRQNMLGFVRFLVLQGAFCKFYDNDSHICCFDLGLVAICMQHM